MTTSSLKNRRRQDIDRTRGRLDGSLEELTHRIDVPERVRDKVHDAKESVRVSAEEVKQQGQAKADEVKQQGQVKAEEIKQQGQAKAEEIKQQVHEGTEALQAKAGGAAWQADRLGRQVLAELPPPVAGRLEPLMAPAKQRPLLIAVVAVGALLVLLVLRRLLRGNR